MTQISVAIITKNEEAHIGACLQTARWADEIVVVDSQSSDTTVKIAQDHGAKVFVRPFENFADQKNFAVSKATKPWVFSLDADESIPEGLQKELRGKIQDSQALPGYYVPRDNYIFGRCLRFGGQGQDRQMRLFRRDKVKFKNVVHEEVEINGPTGTLESPLSHHTLDNLNDYFKKLAQYTDLEVHRMKEKGITYHWTQLAIKPWLRFFYTYIVQGGFLDGYQGFLFHSLSAFYAFVKYAKLREAENAPPPQPSPVKGLIIKSQ